MLPNWHRRPVISENDSFVVKLESLRCVYAAHLIDSTLVIRPQALFGNSRREFQMGG